MTIIFIMLIVSNFILYTFALFLFSFVENKVVSMGILGWHGHWYPMEISLEN